MSIWIDTSTRVLVQGITGHAGLFHTRRCLDYGTKIVAGVTPRKGGETVHGCIPIFNTVAEACAKTHPDASMILVPAASATDAMLEAIDAKIPLVVCITEHIPTQDMARIRQTLRYSQTRLIGANCPGIIAPGKCKIGIIPQEICQEGSIGVVSRSGTLMFEAIEQLTQGGLGQSTCVGIGGDPITGTSYSEVLEAFENDPQTKGIVLIGEIGGDAEERAADYIRKNIRKPIVGFIAGHHAPKGKRMGHAGAIISGHTGTAASKIQALQASGVKMATYLSDIGEVMRRTFKG